MQKYNNLIRNIGSILEKGREQVFKAINSTLVYAYWQIGKQIVEYEQAGKERAEYGSELLFKLSKDLKVKYGKGFSRSNLQCMRLLYQKYPICQTVSGKSQKSQTISNQLSWSHYIELLGVEDDLERSFF